MPVTKSAKKKLRVDRHRRAVNIPVLSRMKSAVKSVRKNPSMELLSKAYSAIDKAKKKKLVKRNKASRLKSRLSRLVKK